MKLEVGMYVRTKRGTIGKIIKITENCVFFDNAVYSGFIKDGIQTKYLYKNKIDSYVLKTSANIIDLIEVGDYVNGVKVNEIIGISEKKMLFTTIINTKLCIIGMCKKDIKTIVTKEQFEFMAYEVFND